MLGLVTVVMATAFTGSYVLIIKQFNFKEWIRACASKRATLAKIVPSIAVAIVKDPEVKTLDLTSLRYIVCTGSSLQVETVNALVRLMDGVDIVQGYGYVSVTFLSAYTNNFQVE
jgi:acyl-coenzyme A synthetase/AMP-(fatty) acid ligase